jgi:hypothetical protein
MREHPAPPPPHTLLVFLEGVSVDQCCGSGAYWSDLNSDPDPDV